MPDASRVPGRSPSPSPSTPSLSLPKAGGAIRGMGEKFGASPVTGTASLTVPITLTPGRGGVQPQLTLSYDSGSGNGPFGLGWSLDVPSVSRTTDKGLPRYLDGDDVFQLSGAEDLVPAAFPAARTEGPYEVTSYRPRTEGLFARVERWREHATGDTHWRVTSRENVTSVFGRDPAARVADPADPTRVFRWLLEETADDRGNLARYTYKAEAGPVTADGLLKRIHYGNPEPGSGDRFCFEVVLDYGEHDDIAPTPEEVRPWPERADPFSTRRPGFEVRTTRLCRRVLMFHRIPELGPEPVLVASTDLEHHPDRVATKLTSITHRGYAPTADGPVTAELPALTFTYTERTVTSEARPLRTASGDPPPGTGPRSRWTDLDGDGIAGLLTETDGAWYYRSNRGDGLLGSPAPVDPLPSGAGSAGGRRLLDLAGDGRLSIAEFTGPAPGHHRRTDDLGWAPFTPFSRLPGLDWNAPGLHLVDLTGDGLADVLLDGDEGFTWHPSLGTDGFGDGLTAPAARTEEHGPRLLLADPEQTLHLADMTGDGLTDLVRVRNGEIVYWPSLGHGRFGPKVTMADAPHFDHPERFDPRRVHLSDVDGSAPADLVYAGPDHVRIWFNQAGNSWSPPETLPVQAPAASAVAVTDLLGHGTACLVLTEPRPDIEPLVRYVDLMADGKPHLLHTVGNGMGMLTTLRYESSTSQRLADEAAGRPWLTRLPFPVLVVAEVRTEDRVAGTVQVSTYRYRHGHYDGTEREFRGFGHVEHRDALSYPAGDDRAYEPPAVTRRWQHTGWTDERLSNRFTHEYWRPDPLLPAHPGPLLPDTVLPPGLTPEEARQAARALRGHTLREEVYAEGRDGDLGVPYAVTETNHLLRVLQPQAGGPHCVVLAVPGETLTLHTERRADDPRISHELTLDVDEWGTVLRSARVAYPRVTPSGPEQERLWLTVEEHLPVHDATATGPWRIGTRVEDRTYEIGLAQPSGPPVPFTPEALAALLTEAARDELPHHVPLSGTGPQRRLLTRTLFTYCSDDVAEELPPGAAGMRALPWGVYRQAFADGQVAALYGDRVTDTTLAEAGYVRRDGLWWAPAPRRILDPARCYLPVAEVDPFGARWTYAYDPHLLHVTELTDPAGNRTRAALNYRVCRPWLLTDVNGNRVGVRFDPLGFVVATAVLGRPDGGEGDRLDLTRPEPSRADDPTTRLTYALDTVPARFRQRARERHGDPDSPHRESWTYADGTGRTALVKARAEAAVPGQPRWVGTGRIVYDARGNPVKKYEPYFAPDPGYDTEPEMVERGVTPVLHYDPLGRPERTEHPDGTEDRVVTGAWERVEWDRNDTVRGSRWQRERLALPDGHPRRRAAVLTDAHADTPTRVRLDALGRPRVTAVDLGGGQTLVTTVELDVQGNETATLDARGLRTREQRFDMLGRAAHVRTAGTGERWTLLDATDRPAHAWDGRGTSFRQRHDGLGRPTHAYATEPGGTERLRTRWFYGESLTGAEAANMRGRACLVFDGAGVTRTTGIDFKGNTLEAVRRFARDPSGEPDWSALADHADPEGALRAAAALLEDEEHRTRIAYDALDRPTEVTHPDGGRLWTTYNEAGLPETLELQLPGEQRRFLVRDIDYDEHGRRTLLERGCGTRTLTTYEPDTFRLSTVTTRGESGALLQSLEYTYDPVGNVTATADLAQDTLFFANAVVPASRDYSYDAAYRLVGATGREHIGQTAPGTPQPGGPPLLQLPHANDASAMRRYTETYGYDPAGNLLVLTHSAGPDGSWTRRYEIAADSDRLLGTSLPGDPTGTHSARYTYDEEGCVTSMPHLPALVWDADDRLVRAELGGGGTAHYQYDAEGNRVRAAVGNGPLTETRTYCGSWERYVRKGAPGGTLTRTTVHAEDEHGRIVLAETTTGGAGPDGTVLRYQIGDLLGSATVELDQDGRLLSYEEYHPYGTTSFRSATGAARTSLKRYRFTGRETDAETGFSHHGARFYAPWLGRWTSPDPAGPDADGPNLYAYARGNPVTLHDPDGLESGLPAVTHEGLLNGKVAQAWEEATQHVLSARYGGKDLKANLQRFRDEVEWLTEARGGPGSNRAKGTAINHARETFNAVGRRFRHVTGMAQGISIHHMFDKLADAPGKALDTVNLKLTRGGEAVAGTTHAIAEEGRKLAAQGVANPMAEAVKAAGKERLYPPYSGGIQLGVRGRPAALAAKAANGLKATAQSLGKAAQAAAKAVKGGAGAVAKAALQNSATSASLVKNTKGAGKLLPIAGAGIAGISAFQDLKKGEYMHAVVNAIEATPGGVGLAVAAVDFAVDKLVDHVGVPLLTKSEGFRNHVIAVNKFFGW
ncbi:SpvB/TcaC N-terminal domain-containing protein [Streptomyces sp. NPDC056943]|uniref:SpvB/TcaC N-terminal domain-containing protein n=1 Tax=Streptomyces sp. NPDC056943 TaxID=3345971 RepID=UPI0036358089